MKVASQRAGWSRLPLRAAAFVVLTCTTILGVSGWREWAARDATPGSRVVNFTRTGEKQFAALFGSGKD